MCAFEVHVLHTRVSFSLRLHEEPDASPAERTLSVCACVCKREESGRACQAGDVGESVASSFLVGVGVALALGVVRDT